mgnify:CR=1 FL=1
MIKVDLSLLWTIINLVVFYLLLKKFLFKPVMGIMEKREQMIADGLKNASDRQEEAETLKKEYESALSGAKEESVKIVENARVEAKRQSDEILADADRRADATIERARKTIETERKQALDGVETQIAGLAMMAAGKVLGKADAAEQNKLMYEQFLAKTGGCNDTDSK